MPHTPGPWTIRQGGTEIHGPHYGRQIAHIPPDLRYLPHDENAANARLIAAAPELLAACEAALPIIDAHRRYTLGDGDLTAALMRSAISQAKAGA